MDCIFTLISDIIFALSFKGPETLLRLSSKFFRSSYGFEGDTGDAFEAHQWKCVRTMSGTFLLPHTNNFTTYCKPMFCYFKHTWVGVMVLA
jgi:hypothetical protein